MKRKPIVAGLALASLLAAVVATAQTAGTSGQGEATTNAQAATPVLQGAADASASANAQARADVAKLKESIEKRAEKTSKDAQAKAEAKMKDASDKVDAAGKADGEAKLAARLAAEFNTTPEAILDLHQRLGASWGNLTIAQTLAANANTDVTAEQLLLMHQDGMGWGRISAGLGLNLGSVVSAIQAENRVAHGLVKADGRVAVIHGEGARAGLGAGVGVGLGRTKAGVGVGAGVKIK